MIQLITVTAIVHPFNFECVCICLCALTVMAKRKGCIRPDSNIALNSNIKRQRIDSKRSGKKNKMIQNEWHQ